ncbi:MAG: hypothetical protein J7641_05055 [Cyanobacteria bacterium SID2]|nr:hypothetical protein [Cyanobacteria bacterium SID2]MBP0006181.1 hypothetical protein [Cyanobacteria bacterium SBC]
MYDPFDPKPPDRPHATHNTYRVAQFKGLTYRVANPTEIAPKPSTIDMYRSLMSFVRTGNNSDGYPVIRKID